MSSKERPLWRVCRSREDRRIEDFQSQRAMAQRRQHCMTQPTQWLKGEAAAGQGVRSLAPHRAITEQPLDADLNHNSR